MAPSTRTADDETELIRLIVELVQENRDLLGGKCEELEMYLMRRINYFDSCVI